MAERWTVHFLNEMVFAEMDEQPEDIKAHFLRLCDLIASHGLERMREPYVKHVQDKLWEFRLKGSDGIARVLYVAASGRRVVVVRVFTKKTQKTALREIKIALKRAKDIK